MILPKGMFHLLFPHPQPRLPFSSWKIDSLLPLKWPQRMMRNWIRPVEFVSVYSGNYGHFGPENDIKISDGDGDGDGMSTTADDIEFVPSAGQSPMPEKIVEKTQEKAN